MLLPLLVAVSLLGQSTPTSRAAVTPPLDGPNRPFQDPLVDRLVGQWRMSGKVGSRQVEYRATGTWVLGHQFLRLELIDVAQPPQYEATVYIGFDHTSERYVAHWLDRFGGRFSETLGYAPKSSNAIPFVFEYPDGPFRTTFTSAAGGWTIVMRQKNAKGQCETFAEYRLVRR